MCTTCGCGQTTDQVQTIQAAPASKEVVMRGLLAENDHQAAHNRAHLDACGVFAINLMSSPGAGKTSLLEATIEALKGELGIAVIEGDLETENDAERIRAKGVPAIQITTGTACHLDAQLVHRALHRLDLQGIDLLFIENVGNLVCPASFDLGQHRNVTLLSVPEGDDKPAKYPVMFRASDLILCTKADLLPFMTEFAPQRAEQHLRVLANAAPFLLVSARQPETLTSWLQWLRDELRAQRERLHAGHTTRPNLQGLSEPQADREGAIPGHTHGPRHAHV